MLTRNRLIRQYLWGDTALPLFAAMAMFILVVSCMFLTTAFFSSATFLFYTPLFAAFWMLAGAWQEKKPLPRAVALAGAGIILFTTFALAAAGTARSGGSWVPSFVTGSVLTLGFLGLIVFYLLRSFRAYADALSASAEQLLVDLVQLRGEVTFDEAAEELHSSASQVAHVAEQVVAAGALAGAVDLSNQRIYSMAMLAQKQMQLASVVQAQGQVTMAELSRELRTPESLIRQWLYQLVRRGRFSGYVDWQSDTVFSQERPQLLQRHTCPNCTAHLELVGQGIIGCTYCGAEIFI